MSERSNRTMIDHVRYMLLRYSTDGCLFAQALMTSVRIPNLVSFRSLPALTVPYHLWVGHPPNLQILGIFGSSCQYVLPRVGLHTLDSCTKPGLMIGYSLTIKVYKLSNRLLERIVLSCNVYFDEQSHLPVGSWHEAFTSKYLSHSFSPATDSPFFNHVTATTIYAPHHLLPTFRLGRQLSSWGRVYSTGGVSYIKFFSAVFISTDTSYHSTTTSVIRSTTYTYM